MSEAHSLDSSLSEQAASDPYAVPLARIDVSETYETNRTSPMEKQGKLSIHLFFGGVVYAL